MLGLYYFRDDIMLHKNKHTYHPHRYHSLMRRRHPSNNDVNKLIKSTSVTSVRDNYE